MVLVVSYPAPALFEQSLTKVLGKQMCYSLRLPLTLENINLSVDCFNFKSVATVEFIFTIHLRLSLRHFITLATGCGRALLRFNNWGVSVLPERKSCGNCS